MHDDPDPRTSPLFVESTADLLTPEALGQMSGLDFIRGIVEGRLPYPPIARPMGMRFVSAEKGRVVIEGRPAFDHYNPLGAVHGGWFGTILDSVMACAVQTTLPQGSGYTTLEYRVNILRPVLESTGGLRAIGEVDHAGRRTAVSHGRLEGPDGKLYATGSTTCMVLALPKPGDAEATA
ncbi:MAG: PaaI family thioesterase [Pseudomonadota bacterium]